VAGRTVSLFLVARERVSKTFAKVAAESDKLATNIDRMSSIAKKAGGIAALAGGVSALGAAAAPAAVAVAAMPAAMLATKAASATLKVGLTGVSEAMGAIAEGDAKALKEALKKLSPTAREFVQESAKLKGKFDPVRKAVQEKLFDGLASQVGKVGGNLLPTVRKGMLGVAGSLNSVAKEAAKVAQSKTFKGQLGQVFKGTTGIVNTLTGAIRPLVMSVLRLGNAGMPLAKRMAEWAKNGALAVNGFLKSKKGSDALKGAVLSAGNTLASLGRIAKNIGSILFNTFKHAADPGEGLLSILERLTAKAAAWVKTGPAQEKIAATFQVFRDVLSQLGAILPYLLGPLAAIASLFGMMSPQVAEVAAKVLAFALVGGLLAGKLFALIGVIKGVGGAFVTVWGLINKVIKGGPIGWILIAIGLLVAGLVLAYQKSETFRAIVQAAWQGIQQAVSVAWNNVIKPALEALRNFLVTEVMPKVLFLWNNVFKPVFSDIGLLVQTVWTNALKPALTALWAFVSTHLGPAIMWLHKNVVVPAFQAIGTIIGAVWNGVIKPLLQAWWAYVSKILVPVLMFLWKNVVVPVFKAIGAIISWAWKTVIQPLLKAWWTYVSKVLAPIILWIWKNIVSPAFRAIGSIISTVWNGAIKPAFSALKTGVDKVAKAFKGAADFIKTAWKKIENAAKAPIKFVVNTVLNSGILKAWNFIADKFNLSPKGLKINLPSGFAKGGILPGYSRTDDQIIAARSGEGILVPEAVKSLGERFIHRANALKGNAAKLLGVAGDPGGLGIPGFQDGGIVGGLKSFFGKAKDWFMDGVKNATKLVTEPILRTLESAMGGTSFGKMLSGIPRRMVNGFLDWIGGKEDAISAGGGGPGGKAVAAARKQIGMPYSWGGGGPHGPSYGIGRGAGTYGFDCSGLTEYAWYQATKRSIGGTTYSQKGVLRRVGTPRPGDVGQPHPGHTYLMSAPGKMIEAPYTGARVRETGMRSTPWWGRPPWVMDQGGVLRPGINPPIFNGTGGNEYVLRPDQLAQVAASGPHYEIHIHGALDPTSTAREVEKIMRKYTRNNGRVPLGL
jgi:hypothetical protein